MDQKERVAAEIIKTLNRGGYEAYFAGGCVRDQARGAEPKDYDIATAAPPKAIQELFKKTIPVGVQFGVILVVQEGLAFEVATFRTEGAYEDGRHPQEIAFATLEEDAKRRDFTVNGLYYDITKQQVIDQVDGLTDLKKKLIRSIGNTEARFLEDHLRMVRAIRFAVQLDFTIDTPIFEAIKKLNSLIQKVSSERIREELSKTLTSNDPARGIELLDETGLLPYILPEMEKLKGVEQPPQYHPEGDVYTHTLLLLRHLKKVPIELAMACLLHDIAKPATFSVAPDRIRFHGHDALGAEMAKQICKRLCFSNEQTNLICALVREHLKFKDVMKMKQSTLRRFLGLERFDLHLELHRIDCLASHGNLEAHAFCKRKIQEFAALPPPPIRLINGMDLIALGYAPGPKMGKILQAVEDEILEGNINLREEAIEYIKNQFPLEKKI